jgi:hypothetical protein
MNTDTYSYLELTAPEEYEVYETWETPTEDSPVVNDLPDYM